MAHIQIRRIEGGGHQVFINGVDFSMEVYAGTMNLVEVPALPIEGQEPGDERLFSDIGFQLTLGIGQLDIDNETAVPLTNNFLPAATRVRSMQGVDGPVFAEATDTAAKAAEQIEEQGKVLARLDEQLAHLRRVLESTPEVFGQAINKAASRGRRDKGGA